ncbi:MAG: heme exporter protein CcmB [Gammaproteobacteria bacterium]|nr:heme exporter protein CcmB [Gammaproteobacteria bacterium]
MNFMRAAAAILQRDIRRLLRRRGQWTQPLMFFVMVVVLFPFALGSGEITASIVPAVVWTAMLLATTLSLEEIFRSDFDDGSLDQLALSPHPLPLLLLAKAIAHWLTALLPLILMAGALARALNLAPTPLWTLLVTLLLGTPVFSLVGTLASALTIGLRGGALLLALIVMPLYIPVLIFGAGAVNNAALGLPTSGEMFFLAGLAVLAATLAPFAAAAGLRSRLS